MPFPGTEGHPPPRDRPQGRGRRWDAECLEHSSFGGMPRLGQGQRGPVTARLQEQFFGIAKTRTFFKLFRT